ncbi:MAG: molecular chaperone DnaJ, partial [Oscillospiraceae bacterium]|nr:molecular chaperone DnaJ [Oscillospiraceae bacterium]
PLGVIQTQTTCRTCGGRGKTIDTPCRACSGSGQQRQSATINVQIPAGIDDGQVVTIRGKGNAGANGGPAGDLQIEVSVRPHPLFEREGVHLHLNLPLTFTQAALGAEVPIPTLDGIAKLTVPEGAQPGDTLRLRGKGLPSLRGGGKGDILVHLTVEVPKGLTKEQRKLLRDMETSVGENQYKKRKAFLEFTGKK